MLLRLKCFCQGNVPKASKNITRSRYEKLLAPWLPYIKPTITPSIVFIIVIGNKANNNNCPSYY
jgi:hypothetical protein